MKPIIFALSLCIAATAASAEPVHGTWKTEPGDSGGYLHVTLNACGPALCGTIAKAFDASGAPSKGYAHLGKKMIWDMRATGTGSYGNGKIWAPDKDKTYASKLSLKGNVLTVKGCVAGGLICRSQTWRRAP
ncbi:DUF2147 domain-containing protein [Cognatishimia sp. WU-CL00825]|uniref:DUF2147 domain-containing protein n=1 Tax=Cognatishimia sp. WU-CL00825 TaxID=3127658 RepID=UPI0031063FF3